MSDFNWGSYEYKTEGGDFLKEEDVQVLIGMKTEILITAVRADDSNTYNNKPSPRWLVDVIFTDPRTNETVEGTRGFSKGKVEERDDRLRRLGETITATGEPIRAFFTKVGRAYDVTGA